MKVHEFDYYLPQELIAQEPVFPRDVSKVLVVDRKKKRLEHKRFHEIIEYINPGDVLVFNHTKVIPARLLGEKETGAGVELVLLKKIAHDIWECLVKPGKKLKPGAEIFFGNRELKARIEDYTEDGGRLVRFFYDGIFEDVLERLGKIPLPPYILKELEDKNRYQTIYAKEEGSAAAPTAGLHFTDELFKRLQDKGVESAFLTLHIGLGTFRPVKVDTVEDHKMHSEYYCLSQRSAETINHAKKRGNRIVAVGTTSVRTLETVADCQGFVNAKSGWTDIYIYPGYEFKVVDALITNFHLPKSTLIMLVAAFAGRELTRSAYSAAIKEKYRFYSFGDAMLIV
ncbi:MAG: tRNA preQ1(34) S-adenosylmethionine ribosyltransferase-isomerase QueA [Bacillota bacterium]